MRIIYLLVVFVSVTALFFYLATNFMGGTNPADFPAESALSVEPGEPDQRAAFAPKTQKSFTPPNFHGPSGKPGMVGPQGPPPNY